jgi:hypothetical protein
MRKNMKSLISLIVVLVLIVGAAAFVFSGIGGNTPPLDENAVPEISETNQGIKSRDTLPAFQSQAELDNFLRELAKKQERLRTEMAKNSASNSSSPMATPSSAEPSDSKAAESKSDRKDDESVTNTQHAGVDEGGIVKLHKNHLVILRRGRLFTVAIGDNSLKPVSNINAFAPDINPDGTWYDEMLISGNTIAVIGYSYQRGGTEIGIFDLDESGKLSYRSTYHLRSNDYYSSRNYASRLINGKLIFYTPQYLWVNAEKPMRNFPALRKWREGATEADFQSIVSPTRIYRSGQEADDSYGMALHTVTVCNLDSSEFSCQATGVMGPAGRVFYVSPTSVYVWVTDWRRERNQTQKRSMLYQMPLDGSAPSALKVSGSPIDQFSFLESNDGFLNVLVRSDGNGDGMWKAEMTGGETALLRVALDSFCDGSKSVPASNYQELPKVEGYTLQNRFIGDYLLYGAGNSWGYPEKKNKSKLYAVGWKTGKTDEISLEHSVDRIEALGKDAVIVGNDGKNLYFSSIDLGETVRFDSSYIRKNAAQGELRSHGFFYKPEDSESGLLGLPIRDEGSPGYENLYQDSASILFLRNNSLNLKELGELESRPAKQTNDKCRASCVDWYGNARPLFVRGRVFGLLGYEIVEGEVGGNGITEKRRINFSPV